MSRKSKYPDIHVGDRYGNWVVIEEAKENAIPMNRKKWLCRCSCENHTEKYVDESSLKSGKSTMCSYCAGKRSGLFRIRGTNQYEIFENYVVGKASNTNSTFIVDKDDFEIIKNYYWFENMQGYMATCINGKNIPLHIFIMGKSNNGLVIDHISRDKKDCRKENLRWATMAQNSQNQSKHTGTISGETGVYRRGNKWDARIGLNRKSIYLGMFDTKEQAIEARKKAELEYYGFEVSQS